MIEKTDQRAYEAMQIDIGKKFNSRNLLKVRYESFLSKYGILFITFLVLYGGISISIILTEFKYINIALLGDSLINEPFTAFSLASKIRNHLPRQPLISFINRGVGGDTIERILARLDSTLALNSDAILFFWDSDVSDIDETVLTPGEVIELRENYRIHVEELLNRTITYGTDIIGLAGPEILGEHPNPSNPEVYEFRDKKLDDYRQINVEVCEKFGVTYIDVRQAFLNAIPSAQSYPQNYLTLDGEHENALGAEIVAKLFAKAIKDWMVAQQLVER